MTINYQTKLETITQEYRKSSTLANRKYNDENNIIINRLIEPIKPVLDANTEKIKSVCISGKYIGVLLIPCPVNPDEPIAIREFLNCSPSEEDQFVILSIR